MAVEEGDDFARVMREIFEGRDPSGEDDEGAQGPTGTGQGQPVFEAGP